MQRNLDSTRTHRIRAVGCGGDTGATSRARWAGADAASTRTFLASADTREERELAVAIGAMLDEGAPVGAAT